MSYLEAMYGHTDLEKNDYVFQLVDHLVEDVIGRDTNEGMIEGRCLDVGCGSGHQLVSFSRYYDPSGLDQFRKAEQVFDKIGRDADIRTCNLETDRYPWKDNTFDIVFSKSVIEHLENTEHFLEEIRRILRPGGLLLLMTPAWRTQWRNFWDDPTHVRPFTRRGLHKALYMSDYNIVKIEEFYQLPWIWGRPWLRWIPKLISIVPDHWKWKGDEMKKQQALVRFSKETMLLGVAKPGIDER